MTKGPNLSFFYRATSGGDRPTIMGTEALLLFFFFLHLSLLFFGRSSAVREIRMPLWMPLRVPADSRLRIALFADLHYGENAWTDWGRAQDANSDAVMDAVLDAEAPDFVIYLGDVITADNMPVANASLYWDRALSPTRKRGIPWASVFGNHDDMPFVWPSEWFSSTGVPPLICPPGNSSISREECSFKGTTRLQLLMNEIENNKLSFSMEGPRDLWPGITNYVLPVVSSNDKDSPVAFLYFLDTGGGSYPEVISNAQAAWFKTLSNEINPDSSVPELIFWHIPSIAYNKVAPRRMVGIHKPCVGSINKESVAAQKAEWGMMDIISRRPSVKAVFVGHNHGLDWCCPYKSLWLCFARHTGYGGYGNWPRGSRIVELTRSPFSLRSWIRMEDGSTHSHVDLSA